METHLPGEPSPEPSPHHNKHPREERAHERFRHFAAAAASAVGSPWAFLIAVGAILGWAVTGPIFHFSDTWQLVINTGTTIVTFLMVFLIQNTQNRDARAIHLKLDELIRGLKGARNKLVNLEDCTDEELAQLEAEFKRFRVRQADRREHAQNMRGALARVIKYRANFL